ncbi:TsaC protein (YrdC-Sua5 domains) required for threonylcarbamoyladenosine t(6)A37 modification in tRNA [Winogradskyella psychrotolerans RS-3]|uniref:Threonylcarbamoyl-AMP synthase n=1 Tax=Winogradskyella psychrotolerans RS-3 TaxID=641526 RepID=S7X1D8_9FLAO|nr:L-threonylcarbamoyladenylate synthase [Winogradskyella psychrotolerans]EPR72844.1 TsaC protein (YrdC-Sua5 domains) required for threonylcarbamoyladenosine t(6)A37 modification in tRNA [Winogradskyella psychrotolerans RS-3]
MSIISKDISKAIQLLTAEDIVAIPTETVYGLAGNIYSEKAITAIFETKKRPFFNPLIVHIPSIDELSSIVEYIPAKAQLLAEAFWPGPITLVLKKKAIIPDLITGGKDTVAVRVPNHPTTLELLHRLDFPLAAPSANPFSSISPTTAQHVETYFKDDIKMVLDGGACTSGIESTIIGFENDEPIIYRLGSKSLEDIEAIVGTIEIKNSVKSQTEAIPDAPGMLERHYAPKTKTVLTNNILEAVNLHKNKRIGLLTFQYEIEHPNIEVQIALSTSGDLVESASNLYDVLHQLDKMHLDIIIAEEFPDYGLGKSINDRLTRATKH